MWQCQVSTASAGAELGLVSSLQLSPMASAAVPGHVPIVLCCNPLLCLQPLRRPDL